MLNTDNKPNKNNELIVKTNKLVTAIQRLSLAETRLIQLAIINARELGEFSHNKPLIVTAESYSETFGTTIENAYKVLLDAEEKLFNRRFRFLEDGEEVKSQWVTRVKYKKGTPCLEILFSSDVINEITNIDGFERFFTHYRLKQTSDFTSVYSLRLYELIIKWRAAKKTPMFAIDLFREQLGLNPDEYKRMSNFKLRVLDFAVNEINEKTDITVEYEQYKRGKNIVGFSFQISSKLPSTYKRIRLSFTEAIEIAKKQLSNSVAETEFEAIRRVMTMKDEMGRSLYLIDTSSESIEAYKKLEDNKSKKIERDNKAFKDVLIGNTTVDDEYVFLNKLENESKAQAKERLIKELKQQIELDLDDSDVPEHVKQFRNNFKIDV